MQIQLFPDESPPSEAPIETQRGRIGPIGFAATPTSYPHLFRALEVLALNLAETGTDAENQD